MRDLAEIQEDRGEFQSHFRRDYGRRNIWKEPEIRMVRRVSRSPSPVPHGKVAFRFSISRAKELSMPDVQAVSMGTSSSNSSIDTACSRSKVSLKVSTQMDSLKIRYKDLSNEVRRVGFGSVDVHHHAMTLGDNPSVGTGPPVTIEWTAEGHEQMPVNVFEARRDVRESFRMGHGERERLLASNGVAKNAMYCAMRHASLIRDSRRMNIDDSGDLLVDPAILRVPGGALPKKLAFLFRCDDQEDDDHGKN